MSLSESDNPCLTVNLQVLAKTIKKLRQFGLSDEQIAEALELPLEVVKQVNLEE
ncbi:MAG: hypothetical protein KME25_34515 [Symplocastrum torsivum CPER-KK1]|uniref:Uncharacterized protein n=1 Tax=Symplocastrum torsivum CPER-KK1 TaxID=450513 RepID=A0A951PVG9_9CYAN|nr:hypothetical protein [Symplocastrum torsivum CPER-KK1]